MSGAVVDKAAGWYGAAKPPTAELTRAGQPSPRALEARGFATLHHVLVQLADVGTRPRFAEACKTFGDIVWCDDLDDLVVRAGARAALAVVVDVVDRNGTPTAAAAAAIRRQRPELPIIVWCSRDAAAIPLTHLVAAGVSGVIFREESDLEQRLLGSLTRASDVAFQQLTDQALYRRVPEALVPVVRYLLDHAPAMPSLDVTARAVGLTPRALGTQLRRAGLPPVGAILTWGRALVAAYRLERTTEPTVTIARSLGFPSAAALSRLLKRCSNETAVALREPGGFGWVLRCFERHLAKGRRRV
jgi:AraC-like DNA-binding protein